MMLKQNTAIPSRFSGMLRENNAAFGVFLLINITIFAIMVHNAVQSAWSNVFVGLLALLLMLIPTLAKRFFHVALPPHWKS